jgi:hypothetical protein
MAKDMICPGYKKCHPTACACRELHEQVHICTSFTRCPEVNRRIICRKATKEEKIYFNY